MVKSYVDAESSEKILSTVHEHPSPDWSYWAMMPGWRLTEAAALLLRIDPDILHNKPETTPSDRTTPWWEYFRLIRLLERASDMDELNDPAPPRQFIRWCVVNRLDVPNELIEATRTRMPVRDWRAVAKDRTKKLRALRERSGLKPDGTTNEDVAPKERRSLLTMIYIMATHKYSYDYSRNNSAAKVIASDIALAGLQTPKEDAVLNKLQDAYNLLSDDLE